MPGWDTGDLERPADHRGPSLVTAEERVAVRLSHRYPRSGDRQSYLDQIAATGLRLVRRAGEGERTVALFESDDAHVFVSTQPGRGELIASSTTDTHADRLADDLVAQPDSPASPDRVTIWAWHHDNRVPRADRTDLDVPAWDDFAPNYPTAVRTHLAELMALDRPTGRGRLAIWHGEPGTGKSTAIRALISEWSSWCTAHYVTDPERLFAQPHYLRSVLAHDDRDDRDDSPNRWKLVIAEDTDEYLRPSRGGTDGSLGRLLNLGDGVLGQGRNVIVLLTTNEALTGLHPALSRPGRCLADIEFARFPVPEALTWLAPAKPRLTGPATLAEMYALTGATAPLGRGFDVPSGSTGHYL